MCILSVVQSHRDRSKCVSTISWFFSPSSGRRHACSRCWSRQRRLQRRQWRPRQAGRCSFWPSSSIEWSSFLVRLTCLLQTSIFFFFTVVLTRSTPRDHWREKSDNGKSMDGAGGGRGGGGGGGGGGGREGASAPVLTVCMHLGWSHTQGWILFWSPFQTVQQEGVEWREIVKYSSQIWTEQLPHWGALTLVDWVKVHILMWCRCTKALTRSIVHEYDQPVWKISGSVVQKVNRNPLWILLKLCVWLLELGRVEIAQYDYECSGVPHRRRFQKFQGVRLEGGNSTM